MFRNGSGTLCCCVVVGLELRVVYGGEARQ